MIYMGSSSLMNVNEVSQVNSFDIFSSNFAHKKKQMPVAAPFVTAMAAQYAKLPVLRVDCSTTL